MSNSVHLPRPGGLSSGRLGRAFAVTLCALVGLVSTSPNAVADQGETRWSAHGRWGAEYDDNPHRLEAQDREQFGDSGAPLMRYLLGVDAVSSISETGQVQASLQHGGTLFYREGDANAMITEVRGAASHWPVGRLSLQARGDIKDRTESGEFRRDYTRGGAALRLGSRIGPVRPWVDGGIRFLAYKPFPSSSHRGPQVGGGLSWSIRDDLRADASHHRAWRAYGMTAWTLVDDRFVTDPDGAHREDRFQLWQVALRHRRRVDADLRYYFATNESNSHGQRFSRHGVDVMVTLPLGWESFLSLRGELQNTRYEDPVLIDDALQLDEDNRNAAVAAISRRLTEHLDVELRYSIYTQEFGTGGEYRRQTLAIALRGHLED